MSVIYQSPGFDEFAYIAAPLAIVPDHVEPARSTTLTACSVCLRVLRDGEWIEPETAIRELRSFEQAVPPRLEPAVCGDCAEAIYRRRRR